MSRSTDRIKLSRNTPKNGAMIQQHFSNTSTLQSGAMIQQRGKTLLRKVLNRDPS